MPVVIFSFNVFELLILTFDYGLSFLNILRIQYFCEFTFCCSTEPDASTQPSGTSYFIHFMCRKYLLFKRTLCRKRPIFLKRVTVYTLFKVYEMF